MTNLSELGWSQDNIAYVIGSTRPAIKKHFNGDDSLTVEQKAKLAVLESLNKNYKAFEREAIAHHAFDRVWKVAYRNLAEDAL